MQDRATDQNNEDKRERERQTVRCTEGWRKKREVLGAAQGSERVRDEQEGGQGQ